MVLGDIQGYLRLSSFFWATSGSRRAFWGSRQHPAWVSRSRKWMLGFRPEDDCDRITPHPGPILEGAVVILLQGKNHFWTLLWRGLAVVRSVRLNPSVHVCYVTCAGGFSTQTTIRIVWNRFRLRPYFYVSSSSNPLSFSSDPWRVGWRSYTLGQGVTLEVCNPFLLSLAEFLYPNPSSSIRS